MGFKRLDAEDFVVSADAVQSTAWSTGAPTLTNYFTSSVQQAGLSLSKAIRQGKAASGQLQDTYGKMGFRGGESGQLSKYINEGVQRAGNSAAAAAHKARLGMEAAIYGGRADYADSLWDLYGDFLAMKPGRIEKQDVGGVYTGTKEGYG